MSLDFGSNGTAQNQPVQNTARQISLHSKMSPNHPKSPGNRQVSSVRRRLASGSNLRHNKGQSADIPIQCAIHRRSSIYKSFRPFYSKL